MKLQVLNETSSIQVLDLNQAPKKAYWVNFNLEKDVTSLGDLKIYLERGGSIRAPGLKSLEGIQKHILHVQNFSVTAPIESHILGVFLIPGIQYFDIDRMGVALADGLNFIIKKHIKNGKAGLIDCQNELIEAGLDAYAQL